MAAAQDHALAPPRPSSRRPQFTHPPGPPHRDRDYHPRPPCAIPLPRARTRTHGHTPLQAGFWQAMQQQQQQHRQWQQQSDDRAARQEARHLPQMAALVAQQRAPAPLGAPPPKTFAGFKSNPCFKELAPFTGMDWQPLRPWFAAFQEGLSAPQRQTFLAQLSGRADVSDRTRTTTYGV